MYGQHLKGDIMNKIVTLLPSPNGVTGSMSVAAEDIKTQLIHINVESDV